MRKRRWQVRQQISDEAVVMMPKEAIKRELARLGGKLFEQVLLDPDSNPAEFIEFKWRHEPDFRLNAEAVVIRIDVASNLKEGEFRFLGGPMDQQVRTLGPTAPLTIRVPIMGDINALTADAQESTYPTVEYRNAVYERADDVTYKFLREESNHGTDRRVRPVGERETRSIESA